ncbi:hypothetical protein B0H13DRAFT_2019201 [Mycena leptocephala]|nr:hypothetical protein B0H13DRAFT_2019201 [Mycena leptocephala]
MDNQLFYHPPSREFRGAIPQSLDSNATLADDSRHMQLQMERQKSMDGFLLAANLARLELCRQAERLLTSYPSSIINQCYRDPQAVLQMARHGQCTSQMAIATLAHLPHPTATPAPVSTQLVITRDIEASNSTVDNKSEIMKRMWRKFRAAECIGKALIPNPSTSKSSINKYQCISDLVRRFHMQRAIQRSDFATFAGTYSIIADPEIDNKERVARVSHHFFKEMNVRRSQCLQHYEEDSALRRYVMLFSCALEPTANQAHTGWVRLLAEDDISHPLGIAGQRIEVIVVRGGFEMIEKFESG